MTSCSALQNSCQENCRASIPWYKLGQRTSCQKDCDVNYATCYANLVAEVEETNLQNQADASENLKNLIVIIMAIIVVIFLFYTWMKLRKKQ